MCGQEVVVVVGTGEVVRCRSSRAGELLWDQGLGLQKFGLEVVDEVGVASHLVGHNGDGREGGLRSEIHSVGFGGCGLVSVLGCLVREADLLWRRLGIRCRVVVLNSKASGFGVRVHNGLRTGGWSKNGNVRFLIGPAVQSQVDAWKGGACREGGGFADAGRNEMFLDHRFPVFIGL